MIVVDDDHDVTILDTSDDDQDVPVLIKNDAAPEIAWACAAVAGIACVSLDEMKV